MESKIDMMGRAAGAILERDCFRQANHLRIMGIIFFELLIGALVMSFIDVQVALLLESACRMVMAFCVVWGLFLAGDVRRIEAIVKEMQIINLKVEVDKTVNVE